MRRDCGSRRWPDVSIYATQFTISDDEHEPSCAKYRLIGEYPPGEAFTVEGGAMYVTAGDLERVYARVPEASCTCGNPAPLVYQGSHVNPADGDPRGGSLSLAAIPNFCHPSVRGTDAEDGAPVEFLRVDMAEDEATYHGGNPGYATVVLDRAQVVKVRDGLTAWLDAKERW
jgi:hypothetical protein